MGRIKSSSKDKTLKREDKREKKRQEKREKKRQEKREKKRQVRLGKKLAAVALKRQRDPLIPGFPLILYMHKEELNKRNKNSMVLLKTKYFITEDLISTAAKHAHECCRDDLEILSRQTMFKKSLQRQAIQQQIMGAMKKKARAPKTAAAIASKP